MLKLELDPWDGGALVAVVLLLVGLACWHWPAALVAGASVYLWVYYHREKALAPQSPDAGKPGG